MRKRSFSIIMIITLMLCLMPASAFGASLPSIDDKAVFHTPSSDYNGGDCVLTACKSMFRRYAIIKGSQRWTTLTNAAIRPYAAPSGGLKYSFDYSNDGIKYHVDHGYFESTSESSKIKELQSILSDHKEGVIVWGNNAAKSGGSHAVLVVKISGTSIYAVDSTHNKGSVSKGIEKWSDTTMSNFNKCTKYWYLSKASGSSTSASNNNSGSTMTISGVRSPSSVVKGDGFTIRGEIESNYKIKNVEVAIINSKGKNAIVKTAAPDSWLYDVYSLDSQVKFGTLATGTYKYRITATDEKKTAVLHEASFKVVDKSSSDKDLSNVTLSGQTLPSDMKKGTPFTIKGKISSDHKLSKVEISILGSDGKAVISKSANPDAKSYDLARLDTSVKFGTLDKGTFRYVVKATDDTQTVTLTDKTFKVTDDSASDAAAKTETKKEEPAKKELSTLRIKSYTAPKTIKKGEGFTIKGTVKSNKKIKKVQILINNKDGITKIYASAKPNDYSFNLRKLDKKVKFGKLKRGTYTYKIYAMDSTQKLTLVEKKFKVK